MTIAILSIIEALKNSGGHIVIVGPTDRQAGELFQKITNFIKSSPIQSEVQSFTQRQMLMKNGCRVSAYPCGDTGDNIRGLTANVLIVEEAAFVKDDIINQVVTPMVAATKGKIIKISTPFGMNHFYRSFIDSNYVGHRYTWEDAVAVGHFSQEFIDEQKSQCSSLQFRTEYEAEFIPDEDAYFPYKLVEDCISDYDLLDETGSVVNADKQYYLGADFARMGEDSSAFVVVEKGEPHRVVFVKELKKNTMDQAIDYIKFLHQKFKFKKICCDQTGLGAGVVDILARDFNRKPVYKNTGYGQSNTPTDIVVGLNFTIKTKQDIFSNLKVLMEQKKIVYPNITKLIYELKDFRYEVAASGQLKLHHSDGGHDDYVDALACAVHGLKGRTTTFFFG
jgi:phage terminase large subunit-like protein|tara:strand:- start:165 stop:1343 length:1179 start_codon:yes stop_codon:yes gene_type:complete